MLDCPTNCTYLALVFIHVQINGKTQGIHSSNSSFLVSTGRKYQLPMAYTIFIVANFMVQLVLNISYIFLTIMVSIDFFFNAYFFVKLLK